MYYISNDGTIARLISNQEDEALLTLHAEFINDRSIGVETGNLFNDVPAPGHGWVRVSQTPAVEDVTGTNLFVFDHHDVPNEVIACWFTTANYAGPAREYVGAGWILFSDAQYRSWAAPRAVPGRAVQRATEPAAAPVGGSRIGANAADNYRRIVLAEPALRRDRRRPAGGLEHAGGRPSSNNPAGFQAAYNARGAGAANQAFRRLFNTFRGFSGHKFAGGHECPGPVFDWHRFARELWDWWWYPFDVVDAPPMVNPTTAAPRRGYRRPDREHAAPRRTTSTTTTRTTRCVPLDNRHAARVVDGIHGTDLLAVHVAPRPGIARIRARQRRARRRPASAHAAGVVSMSFVLVRHLIFHQTVGGADPMWSLRLDYDRAPSTVYSLYMHIGHPADLDLHAVNPANPDWLNRVHIRKKECDLGIEFYNDPITTASRTTSGTSRCPASSRGRRSTTGWRTDRAGARDLPEHARGRQRRDRAVRDSDHADPDHPG